jgi:hypothetical protein
MAVARISIPRPGHTRGFGYLADLIEADQPRGARELRRSAATPGRRAELTDVEMRALWDELMVAAADGFRPALRLVEYVKPAMDALALAEADEAARPSGMELLRQSPLFREDPDFPS